MVFCPAKINLYLYVLGCRADGYHEIDTAMSTLDIGDELSFEESAVDELTCSAPALVEDNLVLRALALFRKEVHTPQLRIHLHKEIPVGSGMGGGSSDAATMLLELRRRYAPDLSDAKLHTMAVAIGMDVPFFLRGGLQRATGRGELLVPLKGRVAQALVVYREPAYSKGIYETFRPEDARGENHLLYPVLRTLPGIAELHRTLMRIHPSFQMTGGGGAFFLIGDDETLDEAASRLQEPFMRRTTLLVPDTTR